VVEFIVGIIVGLILYFAFGERKHTSGTLVIDFSDPMIDQPFSLELHENVNDIYTKKQIVLKVKTISQN
jgi:hypothetical protein